jgi:hypothetical protein
LLQYFNLQIEICTFAKKYLAILDFKNHFAQPHHKYLECK